MGEQPGEQSLPNLGGSPVKVAIGICSRGEWTSDTALSVVNLVKHFVKGCPDGDVKVIAMSGFIVPEQRCRVYAEAERWGATHVLFIDTDMGFPDYTLAQLLSHGKAMVGVNYPRKSFPYWPTAYVDDDDYTGSLFTTDETEGLQKVSHIGFGCVLIDMQVFDLLLENAPKDKPPLFHFEPNKQMTRWTTEDVYFCRRAKSLGVDIWVDHDLSKEVMHVGTHRFKFYDSVAAQEAVKDKWSAGVKVA